MADRAATVWSRAEAARVCCQDDVAAGAGPASARPAVVSAPSNSTRWSANAVRRRSGRSRRSRASRSRIDTNQGKKLFPVNEVQKVTFKDEPRELRNARDGILRGQLENARSDLEKISLDGIARKEILQDIEFYKAYCDGRLALVGGGDKAAAVRALRAFVENPDEQRELSLLPGRRAAGRSGGGAGQFRQRHQVLQHAGRSALAGRQDERRRSWKAMPWWPTASMPRPWPSSTACWPPSLDDARAREQKLLATLGRAVCLAGTGKPDEGIALVTKIIDENNSQEKPVLFAKAYNALGTCYLKANKPQDALLAFLHVDLLFNQDPDAHAEALYHLSSLVEEAEQVGTRTAGAQPAGESVFGESLGEQEGRAVAVVRAVRSPAARRSGFRARRRLRRRTGRIRIVEIRDRVRS